MLKTEIVNFCLHHELEVKVKQVEQACFQAVEIDAEPIKNSCLCLNRA